MVLAAGLAAQQPGVHPVSGRRFAPVMGYQGAPWLERSEREEEEAPDVALERPEDSQGRVGRRHRRRLRLHDGAAGRAGRADRARVYANDIQPQMLEILARRLNNAKITNVDAGRRARSTTRSCRRRRSTSR